MRLPRRRPSRPQEQASPFAFGFEFEEDSEPEITAAPPEGELPAAPVAPPIAWSEQAFAGTPDSSLRLLPPQPALPPAMPAPPARVWAPPTTKTTTTSLRWLPPTVATFGPDLTAHSSAETAPVSPPAPVEHERLPLAVVQSLPPAKHPTALPIGPAPAPRLGLPPASPTVSAQPPISPATLPRRRWLSLKSHKVINLPQTTRESPPVAKSRWSWLGLTPTATQPPAPSAVVDTAGPSLPTVTSLASEPLGLPEAAALLPAPVIDDSLDEQPTGWQKMFAVLGLQPAKSAHAPTLASVPDPEQAIPLPDPEQAIPLPDPEQAIPLPDPEQAIPLPDPEALLAPDVVDEQPSAVPPAGWRKVLAFLGLQAGDQALAAPLPNDSPPLVQASLPSTDLPSPTTEKSPADGAAALSDNLLANPEGIVLAEHSAMKPDEHSMPGVQETLSNQLAEMTPVHRGFWTRIFSRRLASPPAEHSVESLSTPRTLSEPELTAAPESASRGIPVMKGETLALPLVSADWPAPTPTIQRALLALPPVLADWPAPTPTQPAPEIADESLMAETISRRSFWQRLGLGRTVQQESTFQNQPRRRFNFWAIIGTQPAAKKTQSQLAPQGSEIVQPTTELPVLRHEPETVQLTAFDLTKMPPPILSSERDSEDEFISPIHNPASVSLSSQPTVVLQRPPWAPAEVHADEQEPTRRRGLFSRFGFARTSGPSALDAPDDAIPETLAPLSLATEQPVEKPRLDWRERLGLKRAPLPGAEGLETPDAAGAEAWLAPELPAAEVIITPNHGFLSWLGLQRGPKATALEQESPDWKTEAFAQKPEASPAVPESPAVVYQGDENRTTRPGLLERLGLKQRDNRLALDGTLIKAQPKVSVTARALTALGISQVARQQRSAKKLSARVAKQAEALTADQFANIKRTENSSGGVGGSLKQLIGLSAPVSGIDPLTGAPKTREQLTRERRHDRLEATRLKAEAKGAKAQAKIAAQAAKQQDDQIAAAATPEKTAPATGLRDFLKKDIREIARSGVRQTAGDIPLIGQGGTPAATMRGGRTREVIGLDIGAATLRAALLRDGLPLTVAEYPLPPGIIADGLLNDSAALSKHLRVFWQRVGFPSKMVNFSLNNRQVVLRTLTLAIEHEEDLPLAVEMNADTVLAPINPATAVIDYAELSRAGSQVALQLAAAEKEMVTAYSNAIRKAGLVPTSCEIGSIAAGRSLRVPRYGEVGAHCIIDIGAETTSVICASGTDIFFLRVIEVGGNDFTIAIRDQLGISWEAAEELKRRTGFMPVPLDPALVAHPETFQACQSAMLPVSDQLYQELAQTKSFYERLPDGRPIQGLTLMGGGTLLPGLAAQLPLYTGLPEAEAPRPRPGLESTAEFATYAAALGLGQGYTMSLLPATRRSLMGSASRTAKVSVGGSEHKAKKLIQANRQRTQQVSPNMIAALLCLVILGGGWYYGNHLKSSITGLKIQLNSAQTTHQQALSSAKIPTYTTRSDPSGQVHSVVTQLSTHPEAQKVTKVLTLINGLSTTGLVATETNDHIEITGSLNNGTPAQLTRLQGQLKNITGYLVVPGMQAATGSAANALSFDLIIPFGPGGATA